MITERVPIAVAVAAAVVAAALGAAGPAGAAVVRNVDGNPTFTAGSGERNRLTVSAAGNLVQFHDDGARVRARGGCRQVNARTARCPFRGIEISARLRDRDDRAKVRLPVGVTVHGGAGSDRLAAGRDGAILDGGSGSDLLRGGPASDLLHAGPGADVVLGGPGDDILFDDGRGRGGTRDRFDGGRGRDEAEYLMRRDRFRIDLARRPVRAGPERDRLTRIEALDTGRGDDRLFGDRRGNFLSSAGGRDVLSGRGGHDSLFGYGAGSLLRGGAGNDGLFASGGSSRLRGGEGNDGLMTVDTHTPITRWPRGAASRVDCGRGRFDVVTSRPKDSVRRCELAAGWEFALEVRLRPALGGGNAVFEVTDCDGSEGSCGGSVTLADAATGAGLGRADFEVRETRSGQSREVTVPLTDAGRTALERGAQVRVEFRSAAAMAFDAPPGTRFAFGYTTFLREP